MNAIKDLQNLDRAGKRMPVLFIGHGSPMNGIEHNQFTEGWKKSVEYVPKPRAIVVVSAHWETRGAFVTAMRNPRVIYDFGGFPRELFEAKYPAPGSPEIAAEIAENIKKTAVGLDETSWGLDHGTWTILRRMYPHADVPVVQLSLDQRQTPRGHFELARELAALRDKGVLIIGSGNLVHNLGKASFHDLNAGYDWAETARTIFNRHLLSGDFQKLIDYETLGTEAIRSVPTPEHFLPIFYALGLKREDEEISLFNDELVYGSLSMTSVKIGN